MNNVSSTYSKVEFSGNTGDPFVDYYGWLILGVKSSLLDDISLFAELRNDYNNVPDLDITKKNDVLVNLGLSYVFSQISVRFHHKKVFLQKDQGQIQL